MNSSRNDANFDENGNLFIEPMIWSHVSTYATSLVSALQQSETNVSGEFNGAKVVLEKGTDYAASDVEKMIKYEMDRQAEEYRNSPEWRKAVQEAMARVETLSQKAKELENQLHSLDINDLEAVLDWFCAYQEPSDHTSVKINSEMVVNFSYTHGYMRGMNTWEDFNEKDAQNYAGYLVGQALEGLESIGAIHQVIHHFTNKWKSIHGKKTQSEKNRIDEIKKDLED